MKLLTLILSISIFSPVLAVEQINKTAIVTDFLKSITNKKLDRYTGDLYLTTSRRDGDAYAICNASRTATNFTAISPTALGGYQIAEGVFGLLNTTDAAADFAVYREFNSDATNSKALKVIATDGSSIAVTNGSDLGRHTILSNICTTAGEAPLRPGFTFLTTSSTHVFLRVLGDGTTTTSFDKCGILGIHTVDGTSFARAGSINNDSHMTLTLDGHKGRAAGDGEFLRHGSNDSHLTVTADITDMHWDKDLETLFVAGSLTAETPLAGNNYYMAITKVKFHANKRNLVISDVIPAVNALECETTTIFTSNTDAYTPISPRIMKIRTMKTSSEKYYLIVNGGIGDAVANVGNLFYALRYNPDAAATFAGGGTGQVVANTAAGTVLTANFTLKSYNAGDLSKQLDGGNTGSLTIGGGAAPWAVANPAADMEVVGDTVYVSVNANIATAVYPSGIYPGVFSSTAMFDKDGVIIGWTNWERVFPVAGTNTSDRAPLFAIDAYNNKIWQVNLDTAGNPTVVRRMQWLTSGFDTGSLPLALDATFGALTYNDCTCVLDLPYLTPAIGTGNGTRNSLALFGGYESVIFAQPTTGAAGAVQTVNDTAFGTGLEDTAAYLRTTLTGAGTVRSLGLARNTGGTGTYGYFFAGTDLGLWVYATTAGDHPGYDLAVEPTILDASPFAGDHSWIHMDPTNITGAVTAIDSDGTYIYVVEQDVATTGRIVSKLWRYNTAASANVADMIATYRIIAQSGSDGIPANTLFTGFTLATALAGTTAGHVGILATNAGMLQSRVALSTLNAAGSNDANIWAGVDVARAYTALKGIKRVPTTAVAGDGAGYRFVGTAFEDSISASNYYQDSTLRLFGITAAEIGDSQQYNIDTDTDQEFDEDTATENRILSFWSDGGRRFTTRFNGPAKIAETTTDEVNMLWSLPYSPAQWNMTVPVANADTDGQKIYWTENISGLGIILAGTTEGVIALQ